VDRSPARFTDRVRAALADGREIPTVSGAQVEPTDLEGAGAAAAARLDEAIPKGVQPGDVTEPVAQPPAGTPPAGEPSEFDVFADGALESLDLDNLQYRDGKKLAGELANVRDRFKPFNEAFGTLSEEERQAVLAGGAALGGDLAPIASTFALLHPDDRRYFANALALISDPATQADGAAMLANVVQLLNADSGVQTPPAPGAPAPTLPDGTPEPFASADEDLPVTRAEMEQMLADREMQAETSRQIDVVRSEAKELGYDLDSQDPIEFARADALIALAGREDLTGGSLAKAHDIIESWKQASIDEFVAAKAADAGRPGAPVDSGAPPAQVRSVDTTDDALEAAKARLTATLGPDPRARSADD
jgi:hypothetical protein